MAHALALDSRDLALELHGLLRDLDPARWRDEVEDAIRDRVAELQARVDSLRVRLSELADAWPEPALELIDEKLDALAVSLREYAPAESLAMPDLRREWMDFRHQLQPVYEGLADSLRLQSIHVPSLRPTNYKRNLFHAGNALVCLLLVEMVFTQMSMRVAAFFVAMAAWSMEYGKRREARVDRLTWQVLGPLGHPHERRRVNSATWFSTALFLLALTGSGLICALALVVLGLADPAAGLIGRRWGRIKLVHGRSLEGTFAFVATGALACLAVLLTWHPGLGWGFRLGLVAAAVLPAALAELFAHRVDDNLLVPMASAAGTAGFAALAGVPL